MDADGARALAERIAKGKPSIDEPTVDAAGDNGPPTTSVEIVHVKPGPTRKPEVRIYVCGPDGKLERRS